MPDTPWIEAYGLCNPDGVLLEGTAVRPGWGAQQTTFAPIATTDIPAHLYLLYVRGDSVEELQLIKRTFASLYGWTLVVKTNSAGRPFLRRVNPTHAASVATVAAAAVPRAASDSPVDPIDDEEIDWRALNDEWLADCGFESWEAFWSVTD